MQAVMTHTLSAAVSWLGLIKSLINNNFGAMQLVKEASSKLVAAFRGHAHKHSASPMLTACITTCTPCVICVAVCVCVGVSECIRNRVSAPLFSASLSRPRQSGGLSVCLVKLKS